MVNIDSLPHVIEYDGFWYELNLGVTFKGKLCISYKFSGGPAEAMKNDKKYQILSQVVEPLMDYPINYSKDITDIVDVPNYVLGFNILGTRVNTAISNNIVKVIF